MQHTNNPKVSGLFEDILKGVQVALPFIKGKSSTQAKGLRQITAFTQKVIAGLNQIRSQLAQMQQQAAQLVAALSDQRQVYQAKRGRDAEVLRNAKTQANQIYAQINALLQQQDTNGTTTNKQIPQIVTQPDGSQTIVYVDEPSDKTWLYIGGGVLLLFLFLKQ